MAFYYKYKYRTSIFIVHIYKYCTTSFYPWGNKSTAIKTQIQSLGYEIAESELL